MIPMMAESEQFGFLDNCSGFIFENYLQQIKRMVRSGRNPLAQIVKRLSECSLSNVNFYPVAEAVVSTEATNNAYILDNSMCCEVINNEEMASAAHISQSLLLCRLYEKKQPLFRNLHCSDK